MLRSSRCGSAAAGSKRLKILSQHNEVLVSLANGTAVSHRNNNLHLQTKINRVARDSPRCPLHRADKQSPVEPGLRGCMPLRDAHRWPIPPRRPCSPERRTFVNHRRAAKVHTGESQSSQRALAGRPGGAFLSGAKALVVRLVHAVWMNDLLGGRDHSRRDQAENQPNSV
jgi:hypothetical protein